MTILFLVLTAVIAYILGNISGGMVLSNYLYRREKRKYFSADVKIGDFYQDFGFSGAALLVLFELVKALIAVLIGGALMNIVEQPVIGRLFGAFALLLGETFPLLFLFKGGKGLIAGCFSAFLVDWRVGLCCTVAYIVVVIFTRYVSLGALVGAVLAPIFLWIFGFTGLEGTLALFSALLIVIKHADNILRLLGGTEPRLELGKSSRHGSSVIDDEDEEY